ncbi:hypothetical protein [Streptomyces sp. NPDC048636]|uniref:hypothetical protein n=1 Tax=Streptomyces sp. NPDC048636 TaxID=3155762 RepID=UPI00343C3CF7
MLHYELHRVREAELLRRAAAERRAREAAAARRGRSAEPESGGWVRLIRRSGQGQSSRSYDTAA